MHTRHYSLGFMKAVLAGTQKDINSNTSIHVCQEFDETWETYTSLENQIAILLSKDLKVRCSKILSNLFRLPTHRKSVNG